MAELESVESQLKKLDSSSESNPAYLVHAIQTAIAKLQQIKGGNDEDHEKQSVNEPGLAEANAGLGVALRVVESGHRAAPAQALDIFNEMSVAAQKNTDAWQRFKTGELNDVNAALVRANRQPIQIAAIEEQVHYAMTR